MTNLKIESPCPMLLARMQKDGENSFFCKSCSKTVIDFRDKSIAEIECSIAKGMCGIFTSDQLKEQNKMSFVKQLLFYGLVLLSFFGCKVKPMNTAVKPDNTTITKNNEQVNSNGIPTISGTKTKMDEEKSKKKRKLFHRKERIRKGKVRATGGCPSF